jgi:hypothetical protein
LAHHFDHHLAVHHRLFGGELASAHVMLAEPTPRCVSGATIAVTGGAPML